MNIMSIFGGKPTAQAAETAPQPATPVTPGNLPTAAPTVEEPKSPFADFADLWKNDTNAANPNAGSIFNVDAAKLQEAASKVDFTKVVTPEMMQGIQAGGEEATQAFIQAMNKMSQQVYAQSAAASIGLVEQATKKAREQFVSEIPDLLKKQQVNSNLRDENPVFNDPAVAPLMQALESQLVVKFPNATSTELKEMAKNYISGLGSVFNKTEPTAPAPGSDEVDWEALFLGKS
jgi:hypothetical protein